MPAEATTSVRDAGAAQAGAHCFVFAGGGTGGHLFPALAIGEQLVRRAGPAVTLRYVCSDRPLDARILGEAGVPFEVLAARPLGFSAGAIARLVAGWWPSVRRAGRILRAARAGARRVTVVAMGGFVAAPVVAAARGARAGVVLVNLDAVPGRANRWIAGAASKAFTSARPAGALPAGWELVRPIVRAEALAPGTSAACRARLGLDPSCPTLMVTGASQGARTINAFLGAFARAYPRELRAWQVLHQTGEGGEEVEKAYREAGVRAVVRPFERAMGVWWGAADLAVSRCGAGSVAEAWANGVPSLFLPYPYHRDQHQRLNALPLAEAGAGVIATDRIEPAANLADAGGVLLRLLTESAARARMRDAMSRLGPADGAARIAEALLDAP